MVTSRLLKHEASSSGDGGEARKALGTGEPPPQGTEDARIGSCTLAIFWHFSSSARKKCLM